MAKNPPTKAGGAGDMGSVWVGKILWIGNGIPLQYSYLGNLMEDPGGLPSMESQRVGHD